MQEVERELRALRRETELGRTAAAQAKGDPAQPSKSFESSKTKESPDRLRMTEAQRNELVSARLDRQFDTERADPSWSEPKEFELSNAVSDSLPKSKLEEVRCRSSLCRLSFTHQSTDAAQEFTATIAHMRAFASEAVIRNIGTDTEPRSVVYLARPGRKLNMPED